jgi:hypothetical protein
MSKARRSERPTEKVKSSLLDEDGVRRIILITLLQIGCISIGGCLDPGSAQSFAKPLPRTRGTKGPGAKPEAIAALGLGNGNGASRCG